MKNGTASIAELWSKIPLAEIYLEHWKIFRKTLVFKSFRYQIEFKGAYELVYLQSVFYGIFNSKDGGFDFLNDLCDQFRARAVTKEKQLNPICNIKNLEFANQIAVLKRALCRRDITIKIEPDLLKSVEFKYPNWIKDTIPSTFIKLGIVPVTEFSSTKACFLATENSGGGFAILNHEMKKYPITQDFMTQVRGDFEFNPTIWHIIKHTPDLKLKLDEHCLELIDRFHVCDKPETCEKWDEHPECLITQIRFRGGKVRPLTMFMPEINYLGSKMKGTFKEILRNNKTNDLFLTSKYYYQEICKAYKPNTWFHSGDLRSCTNNMDPRLSRAVLWDVWQHVTGDKGKVYERILMILFSYYRLYEADAELDEIRRHAPISQKRDLVGAWCRKTPYIKQLNGQHMGMSLSFWIMGVMHAITSAFVYKTPVPALTSNEIYDLKLGKGINPQKIDKYKNSYYWDKTLTFKKLNEGRVYGYGDDTLHLSTEILNIILYKELIKDWNQEWSKKGDYLTQEGCVFTERVFSRYGSEIRPLVHIKSKVMFPENTEFAFSLDTLKQLDNSFDNEYDTSFLVKQGKSPHKYIDMAKRIIFNNFRQLRYSKIPIHLPPRLGGLGMPGNLFHHEYVYLKNLATYSENPEFYYDWKRIKKATEPELFKEQPKYAKLTKTHEGTIYYPKSVLRHAIGKITSISENLINARPKVIRHVRLNEYVDKYNNFIKKMKVMLTKKKIKFDMLKLNNNLRYEKSMGIDSELESALDLNREKNYKELSKNFNNNEVEQVNDLIRQYRPFNSLFDAYFAVHRELKKRYIKSKVDKPFKEVMPYENKKSVEAFYQWEPFLPYTIVRIGLRDNGELIRMTRRDVPEGFKVKVWDSNHAIFYKVIDTEYKDLSKRQVRFLKTLLFEQHYPNEVKEQVLDGSVPAAVRIRWKIDPEFNFSPKVYRIDNKKLIGKTLYFLTTKEGTLPITGWKTEIISCLISVGVLSAAEHILCETPWSERLDCKFKSRQDEEIVFRENDTFKFRESLMTPYIHDIFTCNKSNCIDLFNRWITGSKGEVFGFLNRVYPIDDYILAEFTRSLRLKGEFYKYKEYLRVPGKHQTMLAKRSERVGFELLTKEHFEKFKKDFKYVTKEEAAQVEIIEYKCRVEFVLKFTNDVGYMYKCLFWGLTLTDEEKKVLGKHPTFTLAHYKKLYGHLDKDTFSPIPELRRRPAKGGRRGRGRNPKR